MSLLGLSVYLEADKLVIALESDGNRSSLSRGHSRHEAGVGRVVVVGRLPLEPGAQGLSVRPLVGVQG